MEASCKPRVKDREVCATCESGRTAAIADKKRVALSRLVSYMCIFKRYIEERLQKPVNC